MDKYKFYNRNTKDYSDCQLIAVINASIYLNKKKLLKIDSPEYEKAVTLVGCRYGSAISIEKLFPQLNIKVKKTYQNKHDIDFTDLPLEISVWHWQYGYHYTCAVDYCKKNEAVQLMNFRRETTTSCWIFEQHLWYFIKKANKEHGVARSFKKRK